MSDSIYLLQADDQLVELREEGYLLEAHLQKLLAEHPVLLSGKLVNPDAPRRWLLIRREAGLADELDRAERWSLDHLFIDQDAIPTLVEVKRSSNSQIRREIVGQMLDYAANAVAYLPVQRLRGWFEERCAAEHIDPAAAMTEAFGLEVDPESFWPEAHRNLQSGRIRLVFAADHLPRELERIIEFLNGQMNPAEVLGLEIPQFVGEGLKTLVPRIVGRTAAAEQAKSTGGAPRRRWDEASFMADIRARRDAQHAEVAQRLFEWGKGSMSRLTWGVGAQVGSFAPAMTHNGVDESILIVFSSGYLQIPFGYMKTRPPFDSPELRGQFVTRLREAGFVMPDDAISRWPSIRLAELTDPAVRERFVGVLDWALGVILDS